MLPQACTVLAIRFGLTADPASQYTLTALHFPGPALGGSGTLIPGLTCTVSSGAARFCSANTNYPLAAGDAIAMQIIGTANFNTGTAYLVGEFDCN